MLFYLSRFSEQFGLLNVFKYQTFRMGGALLVAFFLTLWIGPEGHRLAEEKRRRRTTHP